MEATSRQLSAPTRERDAARAPATTPAELAWIAALPVAALTLAAVVLLGPPLGDALLAPGRERLWPRDAIYLIGQPEPVKHARFALALLGPLLLAAVVLVGGRRGPRLPVAVTRALVLTSQALLCAGLVTAVVAQRQVAYPGNIPASWHVFSVPALGVAGLVAATLALALRAPAITRYVSRSQAAPRWSAALCLALAVAATAVWLLPVLSTEHTAANDAFPDLPPWAMGDTYAILDGRTPLVDFRAVYGQLWGYVAAVPMAAFGATIDSFSIVMVLGSGLALLAVYATLRRIARSAPLALALYLPFLATSLFVVGAPGLPWRITNAAVHSVWPMRYAGPWLLAWLTVRHLAGARPRAVWPLGLASGLVAINNLEFGGAALAATLLALAAASADRSWRALGRRAAGFAAGTLAAVLLVSLLTLVRAGSLPHFDFMLEYPRLFGTLGFVSLPMAAVGFHLVLYATYAAALATAAARVARGARDPLTAMLAWSGIFGLLAGGYFAGRSDPIKLAALFPAWSFALTLLIVVVVRRMAAQDRQVPSLAQLAVLVGFGLGVCSLAQAQAPWREVQRLRAGGAIPQYQQPVPRELVDSFTRRGEHVAILIPLGHRIAYELGVVNVSPYGYINEMATRAQMRTLLASMRAERAHKLFLLDENVSPTHERALARAGFTWRAASGRYSYWADSRVGS